MSGSVENRLRELYVRALRLHVNPLDLPRDELLTKLAIDSIKAMEILVNIEIAFNIEIEPDCLSVGLLDSFDGLARYIAAKK